MFSFERNWNFPYIKQGLLDRSELLFYIKDTFLSSGSGKWSVASSATQTAAGFVDLWTSPAAINLTTVFTTIWCNLKYEDENYLFYLLLRYQNGTITIATSYDVTPTGGNSTTLPTSNDLRETQLFIQTSSLLTEGNFCSSITSDGTNIRFFNLSGRFFAFGVDDRFFDQPREKCLFVIDTSRLRYTPYDMIQNSQPYFSTNNNYEELGAFVVAYDNARPIQQAMFFGTSLVGHLGSGGIIPPDLYFTYHYLSTGDTLSDNSVKKFLYVGRGNFSLVTPIPENF